MALLDTAKSLAQERHAGQYRPNLARQPKIDHIAEVANLVQQSGGNDIEIAAAWLHDIIEDTPTSLNEIRALFGDGVAQIVDGLTDPPRFVDLPLHIRKQQQAERLHSKSASVKHIKLCDQISNIRSVQDDPPSDWSNEKCLTYIEGAKKIADICINISPFLNIEFERAYESARQKYLTK